MSANVLITAGILRVLGTTKPTLTRSGRDIERGKRDRVLDDSCIEIDFKCRS
jgi:hypothetical protein